MKKLLFFVPTVIVILLILGTGWMKGQADTSPAQRIEDRGIVMLPSTLPVEQKIQRAALDVLAADAPTRAVFVYAITDVSQRDGYYFVSVAGLPLGAEQMSLEDALWLGMVTLTDDAALAGTVEDLVGSQPGQPGEIQGIGGSQNILPFRDTTTATYGVLGVHDCGFSLNGWKAVDLFPSENQVYSTNEGQVSYVCRDGTQVAMRIGDNLYTHIVDTGQSTGDKFTQGQALGAMVPGTYTATCGYASQTAQAYHVHFCFIPNPAGTWAADGYALNIGNGNWVKGAETVSPTGTLTAAWANAGVTGPGPTAGGNFWDGIISGVMALIQPVVEKLPEHQVMGISDQVLGIIATPLRLLYLVILINFDMTTVMWVVGIITVLEGVRILYSAWMWLKRAIPIVG